MNVKGVLPFDLPPFVLEILPLNHNVDYRNLFTCLWLSVDRGDLEITSIFSSSELSVEGRARRVWLSVDRGDLEITSIL